VRVSADRIAIVRALPGLGEMLCAIPALRAVRGTAPRAHITLIGLESSRWVVDRFPTYVDELWAFPGFPGIPGTDFEAGRTVRFLAEAHEREFDLVLQLHDAGGAANAFARLLGATRTAGSVLPGAEQPDRELFVELHPGDSEAHRLMRVVENLGARPTRDDELEFIIGAEDEAELADQGIELEAGGYACLHPGRWDAKHVAAVTEALAERGLQTFPLADELSLGATAAALRGAALTVCDDSGIAQLTAAVDTPSVVILAPDGDSERWAPLDPERHRTVGGSATAADVIAEVDALLARSEPEESRA
jgi:ADP-heptose:LPS heptosyltransferase